MPSIMAKSERTFGDDRLVVRPDNLTGLPRLTQVLETRRHHVAVSLLNEVPARDVRGSSTQREQGQEEFDEAVISLVVDGRVAQIGMK